MRLSGTLSDSYRWLLRLVHRHGGRRLVDPVLLLHATSVLFSSVGVVTVSCAAVLW